MLRNCERRLFGHPGIELRKTYLSFCTVRWLNVVHDVNVNIVEDDTLFGHSGSFPKNATKDDTSLCR